MAMEPLSDALSFGLLRAAEDAAVGAASWIGRGAKESADQGAVDAMRKGLGRLPMNGRIVIGEGERDEAPMLYVGEELGEGGPGVDIALDPLEGTTITAQGGYGAMAVLAGAARGGLLHAPDVYMDKIAAGPGVPADALDLTARPEANMRAAAEALSKRIEELTVCVLDRPRHEHIIAAARALGARVRLIPDGDVAGALQTAEPDSEVDLYIGQGGAPEGVIAAAALKCVGGVFQGRLHFRNDDERARAKRIGVTDFDRVYDRDDLVPAEPVFIAVGVTDGPLTAGVRMVDGRPVTDALMIQPGGVRRRVRTHHPAL